eukprot:1299483-Heterocapsa_arctica.AAC.1
MACNRAKSREKSGDKSRCDSREKVPTPRRRRQQRFMGDVAAIVPSDCGHRVAHATHRITRSQNGFSNWPRQRPHQPDRITALLVFATTAR